MDVGKRDKEKIYEIVITDIEVQLTDNMLSSYFKRFGTIKSVNFLENLDNFVQTKRVAKIILASKLKKSELAKLKVHLIGTAKVLLQTVTLHKESDSKLNGEVKGENEIKSTNEGSNTIEETAAGNLKNLIKKESQYRLDDLKTTNLHLTTEEEEGRRIKLDLKSSQEQSTLIKKKEEYQLSLPQKLPQPTALFEESCLRKHTTATDGRRKARRPSTVDDSLPDILALKQSSSIVPQLLDAFEASCDVDLADDVCKHSKYEFIKCSSKLKTGATNYRFNGPIASIHLKNSSLSQVKTKYGVIITNGQFVDHKWSTTDTPQKKEARRQRSKYLPYKKGAKRSKMPTGGASHTLEAIEEQAEFQRILEVTAKAKVHPSKKA